MYNKLVLIPKVGGENVERSKAVIEYIEKLIEAEFKDQLTVCKSCAEYDDKTIIIPVGGDGTVLYAAKEFAQGLTDELPILGINLGKIGFLTDIQNHEAHIRSLIATLLELEGSQNCGPLVEDQRTLIEAQWNNGSAVAMNDIVISNLYSDNIIKYEMEIGGSYAGMHKANGVIIATPTGSTAYAMNVGGPIIEPDLEVLEIIPIAGMGLSVRPIIVGGNNEVVIRIKGEAGRTVSIKADGQQLDTCPGHLDLEIHIKQYERKVRLVHFNGWNFFEKMTSKLNWNI